jgi:catechol 2,3-dioxygenase-like lactoylglutathione lyase family enzyme
MITEIAHFTSNLPGMVEFYRQVLGKEPDEQTNGTATFQSGTVQLFLHEMVQPGEGQLPPEKHVAIAVPDLEKACQKLTEAGIPIEKGPQEYYWGKSAYLRDPDGNQIELHQSEVNWSAVHRYFSVGCFNRAWDLIDKKVRTAEEDESMIALAHASLYHWSQRPDCTDQNRSIGYWQVARIYALVKQADNARRYGQLSLRYSQDGAPWLIGYAYEALARAEHTAGNFKQRDQYLADARRLADQETDEESRKMLTADLDSIQSVSE